jgi:predicted AAA+ superfamily ATPase
MSSEILRQAHLDAVAWRFGWAPVVAVVGARQVGKSTLARAFARNFAGPVTWFDLESAADVARLAEPQLALEGLRGLVVLDEIHRVPGLFVALRPLADRPDAPARFLVLGSASRDVLRQGAETLAGRIAYHELPPLDLGEAGPDRLDRLWLRGGFPRSFVARTDAESLAWRRDFIASFLERDVPSFGSRVAPSTLRRFWTMLAHWHGQVFNASEFGRNFGVSHATVRNYLDLLDDLFVVRQLRPWSANVAKRQVKAPRTYVADTGLLHALLDIPTSHDLLGHSKVGASWEWFAIRCVVRRLGARPDQCWFWATHASAELDLLVTHGERRLGFEIKRTVSPAVTRSMRIAREDLALESLDVVHAGSQTFPLPDGFRALALSRVLEDLRPLEPPPSGEA